MKREILFRGKTKENCEWVFGYLYYNQWHDTYHINSGNYGSLSHIVIPETVCQFTGLLDKNQVKIFEGDVLNVKTTYQDNWADRRFQDKTLVTVVFSEGSFRRDETGELLSTSIWCIVNKKIDYEIIGNIHDNDTNTQ